MKNVFLVLMGVFLFLSLGCSRSAMDQLVTSETNASGSASGIVLDITSRAAANTPVTLYRNASFYTTTTTTEGGIYSFGNLSVGTYNIVARNSIGHSAKSSDFSIQASSQSINIADLQLKYPGNLKAKVLLDGRSFHDGVEVALYRPGSPVQKWYTDIDGSVLVSNLLVGTYNISINRNGFRQYVTTNIGIKSDQAKNLGTITLLTEKSSSISGTGVPSASLGAENDYYIDTTNGKSYQKIAGVWQPIGLPSNGRVGSLAGKVTDFSNGVALSNVQLQLLGTGMLTTSTANGTYSMSGIPIGSYQLVVIRTGYVTESPVSVTINDGQITIQNPALKIQKGSISGHVYPNGDAENNVAGVWVRIPGTSYETYTNSQGNFAFSSLPVGAYTLEFSRTGYTTKTVTNVVVTFNQETIQTVGL